MHEDVNEELLSRAVKYLFEDGTGVCYSCGTGLDRGYMRNGRPAAIARMRSKVGCNWTALPGIEYCLQDVTRICLAQPLLLALDDMVAADEENSMENLLRRYEGHLAKAVQLIKDGVDWHVKYKWQQAGGGAKSGLPRPHRARDRYVQRRRGHRELRL